MIKNWQQTSSVRQGSRFLHTVIRLQDFGPINNIFRIQQLEITSQPFFYFIFFINYSLHCCEAKIPKSFPIIHFTVFWKSAPDCKSGGKYVWKNVRNVFQPLPKQNRLWIALCVWLIVCFMSNRYTERWSFARSSGFRALRNTSKDGGWHCDVPWAFDSWSFYQYFAPFWRF